MTPAPRSGAQLLAFGLTKRFGGHAALDGVDVSLHGGLLTLLGPNGSGKTTFLRLLAGLVSPAAGRLGRHGASVAYVSQRHDHHQWMPLTGGEVLRMGRYRNHGLLGRLGPTDRRAITRAATRLEVGDLLDRRFGALSGGQRQRVLIAMALAVDADCLLLDEPITGLDLASQKVILDVVDQERDRGRLVVMSTHHLDEARECDRVIVLATQVVADGPPDTALKAEPLARAFGQRVLKLTDGEHAETILLDDHGHSHGDVHDHHHDQHHPPPVSS